jgi:hypothetical protein
MVFLVFWFLPSFSHHWSNVFTLAASIYPVRVSKKIRFGLYFSRFLAFISLTTIFLSRRHPIEELTINLPRRRVLGTEGILKYPRWTEGGGVPFRVVRPLHVLCPKGSLGEYGGIWLPRQNFPPKHGFMSSDDK